MKKIFSLILICFSLSLFGQNTDTILNIAKNLPGNAEAILIEKISGGLTNDNYKVILDPNVYFFRLNNCAENTLGCSLDREFQITNIISAMGICPKVVFYSKDDGILVTEFIASQTKKTDLREKEMNEKFCCMISSLHSLKVLFPTEYDPYANIEDYLRNALALDISLPEAIFDKILPLMESFKLLDIKNAKTPAHLDLHAGNLLDDGNQLWLIDWEYAAMGDPYFDLATLASVENFSNQEMDEFLACYLKKAPKDEEIAHFYRMRILADVRWALWSYLQSKISLLDEDFTAMGDEYLKHALERV